MIEINVFEYCLRYQILYHVLIRCVGVGKEKVVVIQPTKNSYSPSLVSLNIFREINQRFPITVSSLCILLDSSFVKIVLG